MATLNTW